ncbi:MAG TPA: hypothetical protein VIX84_04670 [Acidimicrobiales bacterium]
MSDGPGRISKIFGSRRLKGDPGHPDVNIGRGNVVGPIMTGLTGYPERTSFRGGLVRRAEPAPPGCRR